VPLFVVDRRYRSVCAARP